MPNVPEFYSTNESKKPPKDQVHHNNSLCASGKDIPTPERRTGKGGYRLCDDCAKLNKEKK